MTSASLNKKSQSLHPQNGETYEPLSSVWEGTDGELLEAMLNFYPSVDPEPILDGNDTQRLVDGH